MMVHSESFHQKCLPRGNRRVPRGHDAHRRGAALLLVLLVLVAIATIAGTLVQTTVSRHRQRNVDRQSYQARWLAIAGLERAQLRIRQNPEYVGETWRIQPRDGGPFAEVVLTVRRFPNDIQITSVADYPAGELRHARIRREVRFAAPVPNPEITSALKPENNQP